MVRMGSLVQARQGVHKAPQNGPSFSDGSNAPDVDFDHQLAETKTPERRYQLAGWHTALADQVQSRSLTSASVSGSG